MEPNKYKESIKHLVESSDNELLLMHWKKQLEWDVEHESELDLTTKEWKLIEEGLIDYENGEVISLEDFISKRK